MQPGQRLLQVRLTSDQFCHEMALGGIAMDWDDFLVAVLFFVLAAIISIGALETDRVVRRRVRK